MALRSTRSLTEYERVLQSILEETERMAHIVDQLLVLARADSGELTLDCSPLPLHDLLLELQQPASILGRQQGVDLAFDAGTVPVYLDLCRQSCHLNLIPIAFVIENRVR